MTERPPLRVLVVGRRGADSFANNICDSARELQWRVEHVDDEMLIDVPARRVLTRKVVHRVGRIAPRLFLERVRRRMTEFRPDLVLVTYDTLDPEVVSKLRTESRSLFCFWYPDHIANFTRQWALTASYDRVYFKDPYIVERFRPVLGTRVAYLPEACRTAQEPAPGSPVVDRIAVVGDIYPYRVLFLEALYAAFGSRLEVYGSWRSPSGPAASAYKRTYITGSKKTTVFRSSAVNVNTLHPGEVVGGNCRLFEIAGAGGLQVAEFRPGIPSLFVPEKEIALYRSQDELIDLCQYYLDNPAAGREMGDAAYRRANTEHTYPNRLLTIAADVGLVDGAAAPSSPGV